MKSTDVTNSVIAFGLAGAGDPCRLPSAAECLNKASDLVYAAGAGVAAGAEAVKVAAVANPVMASSLVVIVVLGVTYYVVKNTDELTLVGRARDNVKNALTTKIEYVKNLIFSSWDSLMIYCGYSEKTPEGLTEKPPEDIPSTDANTPSGQRPHIQGVAELPENFNQEDILRAANNVQAQDEKKLEELRQLQQKNTELTRELAELKAKQTKSKAEQPEDPNSQLAAKAEQPETKAEQPEAQNSQLSAKAEQPESKAERPEDLSVLNIKDYKLPPLGLKLGNHNAPKFRLKCEITTRKTNLKTVTENMEIVISSKKKIDDTTKKLSIINTKPTSTQNTTRSPDLPSPNLPGLPPPPPPPNLGKKISYKEQQKLQVKELANVKLSDTTSLTLELARSTSDYSVSYSEIFKIIFPGKEVQTIHLETLKNIINIYTQQAKYEIKNNKREYYEIKTNAPSKTKKIEEKDLETAFKESLKTNLKSFLTKRSNR